MKNVFSLADDIDSSLSQESLDGHGRPRALNSSMRSGVFGAATVNRAAALARPTCCLVIRREMLRETESVGIQLPEGRVAINSFNSLNTEPGKDYGVISLR